MDTDAFLDHLARHVDRKDPAPGGAAILFH